MVNIDVTLGQALLNKPRVVLCQDWLAKKPPKFVMISARKKPRKQRPGVLILQSIVGDPMALKPQRSSGRARNDEQARARCSRVDGPLHAPASTDLPLRLSLTLTRSERPLSSSKPSFVASARQHPPGACVTSRIT